MIHTLLAIALVLGGGGDRAGGRDRCARAGNPYCGPMAAAGGGCVPATGAAIVDSDWSDLASGAAPTRTLNQGPTSPGCASDWERLQIIATSGAAQYSAIANFTICPAANPVSIGCWVVGTSAGGTTDWGTFTGAWHTAPLTFTTVAAFYKLENQLGTGLDRITIGNLSAVNGQVDRSAVDFKVWGCRCVAGATITQ